MPEVPDQTRPHVLIVGAGAGGLFCAAGLVDTARVTVLEAGEAPEPIPDWMDDDLVTPDDVDWGRKDADTGLTILRGRVSGGCTSINSAAALRGQPADFDDWGIPGWTWADVEPAFAALETDAQFGDRPGHGDAGLLPITRLSFGPIDTDFADWAQSRGHAWVEDQNAPGALGVGHWPTNVVGDAARPDTVRSTTVRWGTHQAVLPAIRDRIDLRPETLARRLVFEGDRCVGVEVTSERGDEIVRADRVVLAAGSIETPLLLLRSGIGPASDLDAAGIPVRLERPAVGADLQDHPWTTLTVTASDSEAPALRPVNGVLLRYEVEESDRVEVHLYPHQAAGYLPGADPADVFVGIGLMRAVSRGSVTITPDGEPEVRLAQLTSPADRAAFLAVLSDAADYIDDRVSTGVFLPPDDAWWRADDLDAALAAHLDTYGHLVGTCRMGTDPDAVVDPMLRVRGVTGLSIADASVMPESPRANTMLTTMMVGVRAARFLAAEFAGASGDTRSFPTDTDTDTDTDTEETAA